MSEATLNHDGVTSSRNQTPSSPAVHSALKPYVDDGCIAGIVAVSVSAAGVKSIDALGFEDIENGVAMRPNSMFWIASQTKPMTAAALMMLVDEGKVSIEDPVTTFIPEYADQWQAVESDEEHILLKKPAKPITVRHLLTHTSGLPFASAIERPTLDFMPLREGILSYTMTPLQSSPGERYQYSNAGINTLGRIIEIVSGVDYVTFMRTRLFEPLGMFDTTFVPNAEQLGRLAKPYKVNEATDSLEATTISQLQYPLNNPDRKPMPAGGLFSTGPDVARFCQMFLNHGKLDGKRYLSEAAVSEMTRKQTDDTVVEAVGLGWHLGDGNYNHGGALASNMTVFPARDRALVYLVQHEGFVRNGGEGMGKFHEAALEE